MKICPMGARLFHVDGQTGRHDKANDCGPQIFWTRIEQMVMFSYDYIIGQLSKIYNLQVKPILQENKDNKRKLSNEILLGHC
jgi:hypothetical protein